MPFQHSVDVLDLMCIQLWAQLLEHEHNGNAWYTDKLDVSVKQGHLMY